jgi:hypothetical protein
VSEQDDQTTVTELFADEVEAPTWPADAPEMRSLLTLPRRERAHLMRLYADVLPKFDELTKQQAALSRRKTDPKPAEIARLSAHNAELAADVQDMMRLAATDAEVFDGWAAGLDDVDLISACAVWLRVTQGPEASRSAS